MGKRFHGYPYVSHLWKWYDQCLVEFHRVLKKGGVLVFKCQDTVSSGKNWFSHVHIMNRALEAGFYPRDMFVLTAKARLIGANHSNQKHARKYQNYVGLCVVGSRVGRILVWQHLCATQSGLLGMNLADPDPMGPPSFIYTTYFLYFQKKFKI